MNSEQMLLRASMLMQQNRYEQAETLLRGALDGSVNDAEVHWRLAICLSQNRERLIEATREAELAIQGDPNQSLGHYVLASVLEIRGQNALALESIDRAISLDPIDSHLHGLRAKILMSEKRWPEMLESAERGLSFDPENLTCRSLRTLALERLGRVSDAVNQGISAVQLNPDSSSAHASLGWSQLNTGDYRKARESFREALRLEPSSEFARVGMLESIKAGSAIYRGFHLMMMALSRLSSQYAWGLIIGLWIGMQVLQSMAKANPALKPWITPISLVYMIFVMSTWLMPALFNTALRFHSFGKHLLNRREIWASNLIASTLLMGLLLAIRPTLLTGNAIFVTVLFLHSLMLTIPITIAFRTQGAVWAQVVTITVAALFGLVFFLMGALLQIPMILSGLTTIYTVGILIYSFVGQWLESQEDRV